MCCKIHGKWCQLRVYAWSLPLPPSNNVELMHFIWYFNWHVYDACVFQWKYESKWCLLSMCLTFFFSLPFGILRNIPFGRYECVSLSRHNKLYQIMLIIDFRLRSELFHSWLSHGMSIASSGKFSDLHFRCDRCVRNERVWICFGLE